MAPTIGASRTARLLRPTDSLHQSRNGQSRSAEFLAPSLRGLWVAVAAEAHTHNLKIVFVGTVGQALRNALRLPPPPPPARLIEQLPSSSEIPAAIWDVATATQ